MMTVIKHDPIINLLLILSTHLQKMSKRTHSPPPSSAVVKRSKPSDSNTQQLVISSAGDDKSKGLVRTVKRTSNLEAPIISLSGAHSVRFPHKS